MVLADITKENIDTEAAPVVDLYILTPAFYSSIVQYSDLTEGVKGLG